MSRFISTGTAVGAGFDTRLLAIWDEGRTMICNSAEDEYHLRSTKNYNTTYPWTCLWPSSKICSGDMSVPLGMFNDTSESSGVYEHTMLGHSGKRRHYFIRGTCKDALSNVLGGAVVQGFRTSDDLFVGQTACDDRGVYELGTIYTSDAHYLVAYYPGSPDLAGSTVNTLTPAL